MKQFEYGQRPVPRAQLLASLQELGLEGWELVQMVACQLQPPVATAALGGGAISGWLLVVKREVPGEEAEEQSARKSQNGEALFSRR